LAFWDPPVDLLINVFQTNRSTKYSAGKRDENGTSPASRKGVRNKQESLSALRKNHCPESAGINVRFTQESLSGMARNHCPDWARICN